MPRVNRDLQRRMAARRERERRRPGGERRYRFTAPEPDETLVEQEDGATEAVEQPAARTRAAAVATQASSRTAPAQATRPFSAYKEEYAYVYSDLRRVGVVIGSLLVVLVALYFVLPLLVR